MFRVIVSGQARKDAGPKAASLVVISGHHHADVVELTTDMAEVCLRGHSGCLNSVSFSSDGSLVVTASEDGTARVWQARSGQQVAALLAAGPVRAAAFSPDDKKVVMISLASTVDVWRVSTGTVESSCRGHERKVNAAMFSADGTRLVTASDDGTARVWDASTGRELAVLRGHSGGVTSASFDPSGERLVTTGRDKLSRVWETTTGAQLFVLRRHTDEVTSAVFSPDGNSLVTASSDCTACIWSAATGKKLALLRGHKGSVEFAAFSPDCAYVVTVSDDGSARVWRTSDGEPLALIGDGDWRTIFSAGFTDDSAALITVGDHLGGVVIADAADFKNTQDDGRAPTCPVCQRIRCNHLAAEYDSRMESLELCRASREVDEEIFDLVSKLEQFIDRVEWGNLLQDRGNARMDECLDSGYVFDEDPERFYQQVISWLESKLEICRAENADPRCPFCKSQLLCEHRLWIASGTEPIQWREVTSKLGKSERTLLEAIRGWIKRGCPSIANRSAPLSELLEDSTLDEDHPRQLTVYWSDVAIASGLTHQVDWESDDSYPGGGDSGVAIYAGDAEEAVEALVKLVQADITSLDQA